MPKWYVQYVEHVRNYIKFGVYKVYLIWLYFLVFSSLFILLYHLKSEYKNNILQYIAKMCIKYILLKDLI